MSDPTDTETATGERRLHDAIVAEHAEARAFFAGPICDHKVCAEATSNKRCAFAELDADSLPAPVREPDEAAAGLAETELARVFSDIDAMGNTSTYRRLAAEFLRSDWLAQYTAKARAEAWDEGHDTDEHGSDNCECPNPYRGGAR